MRFSPEWGVPDVSWPANGLKICAPISFVYPRLCLEGTFLLERPLHDGLFMIAFMTACIGQLCMPPLSAWVIWRWRQGLPRSVFLTMRSCLRGRWSWEHGSVKGSRQWCRVSSFSKEYASAAS